MTTIISGTPDKLCAHSLRRSTLTLLAAVGTPAALIIVSLSIHGWTAVDWIGAVVWGGIATFTITIGLMAARLNRWTHFDLLETLGSIFAQPGADVAWVLGIILQMGAGVLMAIAWVYTMALFGWRAFWVTGLFWGAVCFGLMLMLMSSLGVVHHGMRQGKHADPGPALTNFGRRTPLMLLGAMLFYGVMLGLFYQWWPIG